MYFHIVTSDYHKDTEPLYHSFIYSLVSLLSGIYPLPAMHSTLFTLYVDMDTQSTNYSYFEIINIEIEIKLKDYIFLMLPGLNPINKNLSSENFSDKNLRILNPQIFSENLRNFQTKYFGAAGWTDF